MAHHGSGRSVSRQEALSAVQASDVGTLRAALNACSAASYDDEDGFTLLHQAARHGSLPSTCVLIAANAPVNAADKDGFTPLHIACHWGFMEIVSFLCETGAAVNAADQDGNTPLHKAARTGKCEVVSFLLQKGARRSIQNHARQTPVDVAVAPAVRELLCCEAPPSPPAPPNFGPARSVSHAPTGPKVALCIGVSEYHGNGCSPLPLAQNDARDVAAALKRCGYDTQLLINKQATLHGMREALETFRAKLGAGGVAFFFFSGHGLQGTDGENYLLPVDGVEHYDDLPRDALSQEYVNRQLKGSGCLLHVVVADACRAEQPRVPSSAKAVMPRGFAVTRAMPARAGSVVVYSCDTGECSFEPRSGRNGYFTAALLAHLEQPGQHVEDLFTRATRDCAAATADLPPPAYQQRPWKLASLTETHICLF